MFTGYVQYFCECALSLEVMAHSKACGNSIKVLGLVVPWFPFKLDSSRGFSPAGWLRGGRKTTQTSRN